MNSFQILFRFLLLSLMLSSGFSFPASLKEKSGDNDKQTKNVVQSSSQGSHVDSATASQMAIGELVIGVVMAGTGSEADSLSSASIGPYPSDAFGEAESQATGVAQDYAYGEDYGTGQGSGTATGDSASSGETSSTVQSSNPAAPQVQKPQSHSHGKPANPPLLKPPVLPVLTNPILSTGTGTVVKSN